MVWLVAGLGAAQAADALNFSADRPGIGDSTGTPGRGRAMIELGLAGSFSSVETSIGTGGLVGRLGVDEGVELRLRLPDITLVDGVTVGPVGVGAKVGGSLSDRWSVSVVPEVFFDPEAGSVGAMVNGNVAVALGIAGLWAHTSVVGAEGRPLSLLAGGGVSISTGDRGGVFVHAGHTFGASPLVGAGGWFMPGERVQLDLAADVVLSGSESVFVPMLGIALGL